MLQGLAIPYSFFMSLVPSLLFLNYVRYQMGYLSSYSPYFGVVTFTSLGSVQVHPHLFVVLFFLRLSLSSSPYS